ncbi:MAG: 16S rRNA (uracil(1498)-N(3))-methyltransferase [Clostridia bacterium]|nr:16S rRNA (uracil(1498)-N(3))-methyltransferase [Clostridia bacterium]
MNRFFVEQTQIDGHNAVITGEDVAHITRVLRMAIGDTLILCDGACTEYEGRILSIGESVQVTLGEAQKCLAELPYQITLLQGLPKAGKMETIIQKCVELGVYAVQPVTAVRSVVRVSIKDFEKKRARYGKVAAEAAKQSRRGILPAVYSLKSFEKLDYTVYDLLLVLDEEEEACTLKDALQALPKRPARIAMVIGPEGGLAREEVACLRAAGGRTVTLGKRILRTETAGMATLAMLQYALGE